MFITIIIIIINLLLLSFSIIVIIIAGLTPRYLSMDELTTKCSFATQATRNIGVLGIFFDMLSLGVCTTRHWQTSGHLLQELNVCTVQQYSRHDG